MGHANDSSNISSVAEYRSYSALEQLIKTQSLSELERLVAYRDALSHASL
jgi:hypothetical protein